MMKLYSDELVELANQAWILNVALAELHRFNASIETHVEEEPAATLAIEQARKKTLGAAIDRLKTRLDALLSKWQRRVRQESPALATFVLSSEPWGYRLQPPAAVLQQIQIASAGEMSLADAERLAANNPEVFYSYEAQQRTEGTLDRVQLIAFSGVDLNTAKMWWSWCVESPLPRCRLLAQSGNLWRIDSCH